VKFGFDQVHFLSGFDISGIYLSFRHEVAFLVVFHLLRNLLEEGGFG